MKVLIVTTIAAPLQNNINFDASKLHYLQGLKLAHPVCSGDKFEISMLIGADYYWEIVQNKIIRGKGPTAVQSRLGYLLSGPMTFGLSFNLLAKSMLMNEFCDPSSKSMLVDIDWFPAHIDDTAVFSKTSVRC
jgi:hypothetical protein